MHDLEVRDPDALQRWLEHVRTALPDIERIGTHERDDDRARYLQVTYASGLNAPSWVLSDGTLRMLALTLLAYTPHAARILLIEEPENGVHPRAIEAVMQSLQSVYDGQVFIATHSPLVLSQVKDSDLMCFAKDPEGAVAIVRGNNHPRPVRHASRASRSSRVIAAAAPASASAASARARFLCCSSRMRSSTVSRATIR